MAEKEVRVKCGHCGNYFYQDIPEKNEDVSDCAGMFNTLFGSVGMHQFTVPFSVPIIHCPFCKIKYYRANDMWIGQMTFQLTEEPEPDTNK